MRESPHGIARTRHGDARGKDAELTLRSGGSADPRQQRVRDTAARLTARLRPPGLSVAVVGESPWSDGFGRADIESGERADAATVYPWFSMTKIVTATAVMQLAERGAIDLEAPVAPMVPEFPNGRRGSRVTIRHLLSHSSGLANPIPVGWVRPADAQPADPDLFMRGLLRRHARLRFDAGERAAYSNLGYLVLGAVVARASGIPYTDYVRANILAPLGMTSTDFLYAGEMAVHAATGYHPRLSPMTPLLRRMVPSGIFDHHAGRLWALRRFCVEGASYGGLIGSVADAARFLSLHVARAEPSILSARSVERMQQLNARGRKLDVALGWFRRRRPGGGGFWEHLGGGGGFYDIMRVDPDRSLGFVAMGNRTSWDDRRIASAVAG